MSRQTSPPPEIPDLSHVVAQIKEQEVSEPGRLIHTFTYDDWELRLDCDITGTYRVTVHRGRERIYSFSIFCSAGNSDRLRDAYEQIVHFLDGDQHLKDLPDNALVKGFYYGG